MAKLFKLALESSDLEGAVAPEATQPALDEAELEQNVEATTQEQAEIEQGSEEIDQALEEAEGLVEQIEANDEKLENPDAVVTAADVEVSEEALKRACYSLGIPFQAKLSFASESIANDIRANARKYLATSNEELKDKLKAIVDAVKKMIAAVAEKVKKWFAKVTLAFGNYTKSIKANVEVIKAADFKIDGQNVLDLADELLKRNQAEFNFYVVNSAVAPSKFTDIEKIANKVDGKEVDVMSISPVLKREAYVKEHGFALPDEANDSYWVGAVSGRYGIFLTGTGEWKKLELKDDTKNINVSNFGANELVDSAVRSSSVYLKAIGQASSVFKKIEKLQKDIIAKLDLAGKGEDAEFVNKTIKPLKSAASSLATFLIQSYVAEIKAYTQLTSLLVKYKGEGKEEKAK